MRRLKLIAPALLAGLSAGCGAAQAPVPAPTREIATLRLRSGFIQIRTGPGGRTYNVLDREGKTLAAELSPEEAKARYPEHFGALERGLAGPGAGPILDASAPVEAFEGRGNPLLDAGGGALDEPSRRTARPFLLDASR